jgi:hypothetical protein
MQESTDREPSDPASLRAWKAQIQAGAAGNRAEQQVWPGRGPRIHPGRHSSVDLMKSILFHRGRLAVLGLLWALVRSAAAQDFQMILEPATQTLVPGQTASFVVSLSPFAGFSTNVTLSVVSLPAGVTAVFSPNPVQPPGTSILTRTAATNAAAGPFTLNVAAAGGGITNTTSSSVTVNFGLLPTCAGAITGVVTDVETGLPIPNATVATTEQSLVETTTGTNGAYGFAGLALGADNAPLSYGMTASAPGYWNSSSNAYAVCGATNTANLQLLHQLYGSISGTVTIQGGGPAAGVKVQVAGPSYPSTVTDGNGAFHVSGLLLDNNNAPADYSLTAQPAGCWMVEGGGAVYANSNPVVNLVAEPVCFLTVTRSVVYADTLLPATNAYVAVSGGSGSVSANTDAQGNYAFTNVTLGPDNTPDPAGQVTVSASGYHTYTTNLAFNTCGVTVSAGVIYLTPLPRENYGNLSGHVYDFRNFRDLRVIFHWVG